MSLESLALRLVGSLVEAGLVALDRRSQATAVLVAQLRQSPPDVTADYHAARAALLGPEDELP